MAKYDADHNQAHAGFNAGICNSGGSQNSCPGYSSNQQVVGLCLQQMWDEGPPPTPNCSGACYQMYGHFINMTDPDVTKVACGFYTTASGKVWAVQNFSR
jgi:Cysteine-rich secretory protein family